MVKWQSHVQVNERLRVKSQRLDSVPHLGARAPSHLCHGHKVQRHPLEVPHHLLEDLLIKHTVGSEAGK